LFHAEVRGSFPTSANLAPRPSSCRGLAVGGVLAGGVSLWAVSPRVVFPPAVFGGCPPPVLLSLLAFLLSLSEMCSVFPGIPAPGRPPGQQQLQSDFLLDPPPLVCHTHTAIHHTILVMAISCKGQQYPRRELRRRPSRQSNPNPKPKINLTYKPNLAAGFSPKKILPLPLPLWSTAQTRATYGGLCGMPACGQVVGCGVCARRSSGVWRRGPVCACTRVCWCRRIFTHVHYTDVALVKLEHPIAIALATTAHQR